ncbi:dentin sialophosphoprotein [Anabrus simplex]|uniref:dentin sialophosphoprotein n=1 Tax=Anabrus simplex TaxID=316456 RepID=UPI0035A38E10
MVRLRWILLPVLVACLYKIISPDASIWADDDALFLGSAPSHNVRYKRNLHSYSYAIADGHGYTLDVDDNVDGPFYAYGVMDDRDMYDGLYTGAYGKEAESMNDENLLSASSGLSLDKTNGVPQSDLAGVTEVGSGGGVILPNTQVSANETVDNSILSSGTSLPQQEKFQTSGTEGDEVKCEDDSSTFSEDVSCGIKGASGISNNNPDVEQAADGLKESGALTGSTGQSNGETEVNNILGENQSADRQNGETMEINTRTTEEEVRDKNEYANSTGERSSIVASDGANSTDEKHQTGSVNEATDELGGTNPNPEMNEASNGESTVDGEPTAESSSDVAEGTSVDDIQATENVPTEDRSNNVNQDTNNESEIASGMENNTSGTAMGDKVGESNADIDQLSNNPPQIGTTKGNSEINNAEEITNEGQETNGGMIENMRDGVERRADGESTALDDAREGETSNSTEGEEEMSGSQNEGREGTTSGGNSTTDSSNSATYKHESGNTEIEVSGATQGSRTSEGSNGGVVVQEPGSPAESAVADDAQDNEQPNPATSQGGVPAAKEEDAEVSNEGQNDDVGTSGIPADEQRIGVGSLTEQKQDAGEANEEQASGTLEYNVQNNGNVVQDEAVTDQLPSENNGKETDRSEVTGDKVEEASDGSPAVSVSERRGEQEQTVGLNEEREEVYDRGGDVTLPVNKETGEQQSTGVENSNVTPEQSFTSQVGDTTVEHESPSNKNYEVNVGNPEEASLNQVQTAVGETPGEARNDDAVTVSEGLPGEQQNDESDQGQVPGHEILSELQSSGTNGHREKESVSNVTVGNHEESTLSQASGGSETVQITGTNGERKEESMSNVDEVTTVGNREEGSPSQASGGSETVQTTGTNGEREESISNVDEVATVGNPEEGSLSQASGGSETVQTTGTNGEREEESISNVDEVANVGNPEENSLSQASGGSETVQTTGTNGEREEESSSNVDEVTTVGNAEEGSLSQVSGSSETLQTTGTNGEREEESISNVDDVATVGNPEEGSLSQASGGSETVQTNGTNGEREEESISNVGEVTTVGNPEEGSLTQASGGSKTVQTTGTNGEKEEESIFNVGEVTTVGNPEEGSLSQASGGSETVQTNGTNGEREEESISNVGEVTTVGNPGDGSLSQASGGSETVQTTGANGEREEESISNVGGVTTVGNPEEGSLSRASGGSETVQTNGTNGEREEESISNVGEVTTVGNPEEGSLSQASGGSETIQTNGTKGENDEESISKVDKVATIGNPEENSLSQASGGSETVQKDGTLEEGQTTGITDQVKEASRSNNEDNGPTRVSLDFPVEDSAGVNDDRRTAADESTVATVEEATHQVAENNESTGGEVTTLNNAEERSVDIPADVGPPDEGVAKGDLKTTDEEGVKEDKSVKGETKILAQGAEEARQIPENSRNPAESTDVESNQQNVSEDAKKPLEGGSEARRGISSENDTDSKNLGVEKSATEAVILTETRGSGVNEEKMGKLIQGGENEASPKAQNPLTAEQDEVQEGGKVEEGSEDVEVVHVGGKNAGTGGVSGKLVSARSEDDRLPDELVVIVNEYLRREAAIRNNAGAQAEVGDLSSTGGGVQCSCDHHAEDISNNLINSDCSQCCPCADDDCPGCDEYYADLPLCPLCRQEYYSAQVAQRSPHTIMPPIDYSRGRICKRHRNAKYKKSLQVSPFIRKVLRALSYTSNNVYKQEVFKPVAYDKKRRKTVDHRPLPFIIERYFSIYGKTKPISNKSVKMLYYNQKNGNRPKVYKLDKLQNT